MATTYREIKAIMETPNEEYIDHGTVSYSPDPLAEARQELMKAANLLNLVIACVDKAVAPKVPPIVQTTEFFTVCTQILFKQVSNLIDRMPSRPIK